MPSPQGNNRYYSDIHALVAGEIIEAVCDAPLMGCYQQYLLKPLNMQETWGQVPEGLRNRCVSCNGEHRIERGKYIHRTDVLLGTPHDPKARILSQDGHLCGHAGLFSTRDDMVKLCQGVLHGNVLSKESLAYMSRNRLGRQKMDGTYSQYLGTLCYVKHPEQYFSEIPIYMSQSAIGLSGFTGHHIAIDPQTGMFTLFLGNRVMNRLTVLLPKAGEAITDYGLRSDGVGEVHWPDGRRVSSSVDYVHHKDDHIHRYVQKILQAPTIPWKTTT